MVQQPLVLRSYPVVVGRDGFIDELDHIGVAELGGQGGAVSSLLCDRGVVTGAVSRDPKIDQSCRSGNKEHSVAGSAELRGSTQARVSEVGATLSAVGDAGPGGIEAAPRLSWTDSEGIDQCGDHRTPVSGI